MRLLWSVKLGLDPQACQNVLQVHILLWWSIVLCTPCWFSMTALQAYKAKTILNWKMICKLHLQVGVQVEQNIAFQSFRHPFSLVNLSLPLQLCEFRDVQGDAELENMVIQGVTILFWISLSLLGCFAMKCENLMYWGSLLTFCTLLCFPY